MFQLRLENARNADPAVAQRQLTYLLETPLLNATERASLIQKLRTAITSVLVMVGFLHNRCLSIIGALDMRGA
jgi:hypothetical protein